MNQKSTNPVCIFCGREISAQLSANQIQDPKQSICKECEEREHDCKCEICGDTVNSTVYKHICEKIILKNKWLHR